MAENFNGFQDSDGCPDVIEVPVFNDADGDGVENNFDACPFEAEVINGLQDDDGCPDELVLGPDSDGDGVPDYRDWCPDHLEVINRYLDTDGCPDVIPTPSHRTDSDGDAIYDDVDACAPTSLRHGTSTATLTDAQTSSPDCPGTQTTWTLTTC